jgi:cell fate regulator YaaT (PSP1 superfamily)
MCCLNYEQETYEEIRYRLPKVGAVVETSEGKGTVIGNNVIKESVRVRIHDTDDERIESFEIANVTLLKGEYENTAASKEEKEKAEMPKTANNRVPKENIKKKSTRRS